MPLLRDDEKEDFRTAVADAGYSNADFELTEVDETQRMAGVYALRGKAVVRRKSTVVTREYRAGHGST